MIRKSVNCLVTLSLMFLYFFLFTLVVLMQIILQKLNILIEIY